MIITTKKIIPIALVAALLGGSVGAFVMRSPKTPESTYDTTTASSSQPTDRNTSDQAFTANDAETNEDLSSEQAAYRDGFKEGFLAAQEDQNIASSSPSLVNRLRASGTSTSELQANHYTRTRPQTRSFWQKHRDKLTVAAGTGGGALIGGLIGGKKGALIGGLTGAGGSALYTYKLRKKARRY